MSQLLTPRNIEPGFGFTLDFSSLRLTPKQFARLCADNRDLRLELTSTGELVVMPPTGSKTGIRNAAITRELSTWAKENRDGIAFDSSTAFTLPNGAIRAPDASWIRRLRWDGLSEDEKEGFAPACPDFVVELRSPTDPLTTVQGKMTEYIENGALLGWLIDPLAHRVYIYRPGENPELVEDPDELSGESILPGFVLNLQEIW